MVYSIIQKSQLEGAKRLDAEYYQPEYLKLSNDLDKFGQKLKIFTNLLAKGCSLTGGATPLGADYFDEGIKFLRVQNIMPGYLDFSDIVYIDDKINQKLKRSMLINDDVLLTITGVSYGKSAVYKSDFGKANINQHSVRIHFNNEIIPEYASIFLNSIYGRFQSDRKITGNTRPALAYEEIRDYKIPLLKNKYQIEIKKLYNESIVKSEESNNFYSHAENLLLKELNLDTINDRQSFVVNLSEVKEAVRLDAEYFQPKYNELIKHLKNNCNGVKLGDLVTMKKGFEPGAEEYKEEGKLFIRVSSLSKNGINTTEEKYLSDELYNKLKNNFEPRKGEILLTKDATPGVVFVVKDNIEGIISGGILRLKLKNPSTSSGQVVEDEYLALCLNSIVGQMQAERDSGGSVIAHWKPEQIKNVMIPILPKDIQRKITSLIRESFMARVKVKELLDQAKLKVEEIIEKGGR